MTALSPLAPQEFQDIAEALDTGNVAEAAAGLAQLAESGRDCQAINFLATRILFQKGRIDSAGAQARLAEILKGDKDFPEAKSWLHKLLDPTASAPQSEGQKDASLSVPSSDFLADDEVDDDDTTPADGIYAAPAAIRPPEDDLPVKPASAYRPAPFDSLHAKKELAATAGRYGAGVSSPPPSSFAHSTPTSARVVARKTAAADEQWEDEVDEALLDLEEGQTDAATALLQALPAQEPRTPYDVRVARLFLLSGQTNEACARAKQAWLAHPELDEARWSYAWCLIRHSRRTSRTGALEEGRELLSDLNRSNCSEPGLLEALGACIEARLGSPSVALQLAQRALRLKGDSLDAMAALAEANAALGDIRRADTALDQLLLQSPDENQAFKARLRALGAGDQTPASTAARWHVIENTLGRGERHRALIALNDLAEAHLSQLGSKPFSTPSERGAQAAQFLRQSPVFRLFGDYSFSLKYIAILDSCLSLLFGDKAQPARELQQKPLIRIVADYLGEMLHRAAQAQWVADNVPSNCALECGSRCPILQHQGATVNAHDLVLQRIVHGSHATLTTALGQLPLGADPSRQAAPAQPISIASLRSDEASEALSKRPQWPTVKEVSALGRSLSESVLSLYCKRFHRCALDRSVESLVALDGYLSLVAPELNPQDDLPRFSQWLATSVGGYLGEVLCDCLDGHWQPDRTEGLGTSQSARYAVQIGSEIALPVQLVIDGLQGKPPMGLHAWATVLSRSEKPDKLDK